jgi:hypothetical protein
MPTQIPRIGFFFFKTSLFKKLIGIDSDNFLMAMSKEPTPGKIKCVALNISFFFLEYVK